LISVLVVVLCSVDKVFVVVVVVVAVVVCSVDKVLVFVVVVVVCSVDKVLVENIKQASLESYMYSRGHDYTTMTLPHLAHTFDLPTAIVRGMWTCGHVAMWACGHVGVCVRFGTSLCDSITPYDAP
jgi:hypothetical protein